jgi:two-component system chemotaxis response regulator CheY
MKVMIVDDSAMMRRILITQLSQFDVTDIIEAGDGQQALRLLEDNRSVDLIVLDWNMPVMDGMTLLKKIRANPACKGIKIVMCTSESEKKKVVDAVKEGADNYIVKPFTPETLKEKLGLK